MHTVMCTAVSSLQCPTPSSFISQLVPLPPSPSVRGWADGPYCLAPVICLYCHITCPVFESAFCWAFNLIHLLPNSALPSLSPSRPPSLSPSCPVPSRPAPSIPCPCPPLTPPVWLSSHSARFSRGVRAVCCKDPTLFRLTPLIEFSSIFWNFLKCLFFDLPAQCRLILWHCTWRHHLSQSQGDCLPSWRAKKNPFWLLLGMGVPSIEAEEAAASSLSHACTYTFVTRPSPTPARISENLHLNLKYEILHGIATKCLRM